MATEAFRKEENVADGHAETGWRLMSCGEQLVAWPDPKEEGGERGLLW